MSNESDPLREHRMAVIPVDSSVDELHLVLGETAVRMNTETELQAGLIALAFARQRQPRAEGLVAGRPVETRDVRMQRFRCMGRQ